MRYSHTILLIILCLPAFVLADTKVYKTVDRDGNPVFTDKPQKGAETMVLPPLSTFESLPRFAETGEEFDEDEESESDSERGVVQEYTHLSIVSPTPDSSLWTGGGNLVTTIDLAPPLMPGDTVQILLDGKVITESTTSQTIFEYPNVSRGLHVVKAVVVDSGGAIRIASTPVTFQMHRPTVAGPQGSAN